MFYIKCRVREKNMDCALTKTIMVVERERNAFPLSLAKDYAARKGKKFRADLFSTYLKQQ